MKELYHWHPWVHDTRIYSGWHLAIIEHQHPWEHDVEYQYRVSVQEEEGK